ncbi:MAG: hypothetical protein PW786_05500 [Arachidicoccus sp.]|nr:hypothetical protein [Arachidicoccus sp.]
MARAVGSIASLLSKDFAKLIVIAMLIAFPIAWWAMHRWLQTFAYKTSLSWWIFLSAGIIAIITVLKTVYRQAHSKSRESQSCKEFEDGVIV